MPKNMKVVSQQGKDNDIHYQKTWYNTGKEEMPLAEIVLGGGCFWCTEAVFQRLDGVTNVEPGYSGGSVAEPTYEQVCSGSTGHAEVVRVTYEPHIVTLAELLDVFFVSHDPTTLNRQGADVGTQYRSVILYADEEQKTAAAEAVHRVEDAKLWDGRIVTEIAPLEKFYPAEGYHHNYYDQNQRQPYCQMVITPKLRKLQEKFPSKLKT